MKLLVLAQTPPPLHGQSLMVRILVEGLPAHGIEVAHVPLALSRSSADIGRVRVGKLAAAVRAGLAARRIARREKIDTLYYVPAPGKRAALWRDLIVLGLARPACPRLVLHWHAVGLGAWLEENTTALERRLAHARLGRADLSMVLTPELTADAAHFNPQRTIAVANGIADPGPLPRHIRTGEARTEVLFLGAGTAEKGLRATVEAIAACRAQEPGTWRLTFAGHFGSAEDERHFQLHAHRAPDAFRHVGFADEEHKRRLFAATDIFCFPTRYPHEGQPLVLLEALAHDVKIVTTRWRAIPSLLPREHMWLTESDQPAALAASLAAARVAPPPNGALRRHYLAHFTRERHLATLSDALLTLRPDTRAYTSAH